MNIRDAAQAFRAAQENYNTAFRHHFAHDIAPLPDDDFWKLHAVFVRAVVTFCFGYKRSNGVEQAARELFRKPLAGDFGGHGQGAVSRYTLHEALQFAKSWAALTRRLYQPLSKVVQDRGDDAYGDLLDALPLAGRDVVRQALGREYGNDRQFEQAVRDSCPDCPQLAELILRGENYVGMSLEDAARDYVAIATLS